MSNENDQEKIWKAEAEQLKADLKNRPKSVQKREVPIKFGGTPSKAPKPLANKESKVAYENQLKNQINFISKEDEASKNAKN